MAAEKIVYDDGSYSIIDDGGKMGAWDIYGASASVVVPKSDGSFAYYQNPDYSSGQWATDNREAAKIAPFYPDNGLDWFKNLAMYGGKAIIDSHYGPAATANKTMAGATYAGDNGKTYGAGGGTIGGMNPLVLLLIGGAILFAIAD